MLKIIIIIFTLIYIIIKSKGAFHMLQQNLYNENNRYFKWIIKNINEAINKSDIIILILSILMIFTKTKVAEEFIICLMSLIYFLGSINLLRDYKKAQNKKPLVITARIKRLMFTSIIIIIGLFTVYYFKDNLTNLLIINFITIILYLVIMIINIINYPIERMVYFYYLNKAKKKLLNMNNLKVIGITGSYGKTSSKNILNDILNVKYNSLATPKNLNTHYGLMITINNHLSKFDDIFIAEMGAYVKGEIKSLCEFVKPTYAILTTIGTAHLETFGSEENIIEAKFELVESLPKDGLAILNKDDSKQVNYKLKNKVKIKWFAINNKDADVFALNIKCDNKGTNFDVKFKDDNELYHFTTKLLGNHNVYNILSSILLGKELGLSIKELQNGVRSVNQIEHRLELKPIFNFYQIDDAYNSNPIGAKSALDVLNMMPGVKVVVTPGMIELGKKEFELNKIFGKQISSVADYVILIGEKRTKAIYEGLLDCKYDKDNIYILNDVRDAYKLISTLKSKKEVYALFENDLPDTYNEGK
ncbi:MAG: Mur ligase family protein [Bacilli bacterium]